jgi:hypothetical protein
MKSLLTVFLMLTAVIVMVESSERGNAAGNIGFSWDTIPKFLYMSGNKQFTAEEFDFIAQNFYWVTFAIGFGSNNHASYDEAMKYAATELKKRNSRIKVLYYWNAARGIPSYGEISEEFDKHPDWDISRGILGFTQSGKPIRLQNSVTTPEINVAHPGARRWWLDNAFRALKLPYIDGLWVDATARIYNPGARRKLERAKLFADSEKGLFQMYDELAEYYRHNDGILIGNFLREHDNYPYERTWAYFDGSFVENHYNLMGEESSLREYEKNIDSIIRKVRKSAKSGKIIGYYAGGSLDPIYNKKTYSYEERKKKLARHFEYNLALYLILAEEGVYFEYNDGFRNETSVWKIGYPEYSYKLGAPKGQATKQGYVYRREFAHASIVLNIEKREAEIVWSKNESDPTDFN